MFIFTLHMVFKMFVELVFQTLTGLFKKLDQKSMILRCYFWWRRGCSCWSTFFRNTRSWHYWHFCITSIVNKLLTVVNWINSNAILNLSRVCWNRNDVTDIYLSIIFHFKQHKNASNANFGVKKRCLHSSLSSSSADRTNVFTSTDDSPIITEHTVTIGLSLP